MRLKDSSLYLCLSILLCRIPPLALVAARGAASPHMEIILPPVDTHHLGDIPQFSSNKASPHDSASKPLALSSQGSAAAALFLHSSNSKEIEASRPATTTNSKLKKRFLDNTGPLIQAPTPEYRITSLALLTTVDGNLHCIDTRNGELFWTRPPQAVGAIVSSNVTKYTKSRSRGSDTDIFASSSIEGEQDGTRPAGLLDGDIEYDSEDWTFIVEPAEIPRLYVYSNSSGLQKPMATEQSTLRGECIVWATENRVACI
ncbi:hypothetical protein BC939DRAFT_238458 [Gamsiella multidivaricata]|uniref:uncharacterized protein n=1 Tax=Gamsiella multidivaricata TaxID=101098 RepID=UPI00221F7A9F|nr:uncharacterized protein BC939DRAFT_238458 [Gamsiella multidivaricata]KAI7820318.1 hypothetical protein BC939DRAFT_238458 [Gamsiella multidivaricata]